MQFLRSVLGSGPAKDALPYELGEAYPTCWGSWTHYKGTSKVLGGSECLCTDKRSQLCDGFGLVEVPDRRESRRLRSTLCISFNLELAMLASKFRNCGSKSEGARKQSELASSVLQLFQPPARSRASRLEAVDPLLQLARV